MLLTGLYFLSLYLYRGVESRSLFLFLVYLTTILGTALIYYPLARAIRKRLPSVKQRL